MEDRPYLEIAGKESTAYRYTGYVFAAVFIVIVALSLAEIIEGVDFIIVMFVFVGLSYIVGYFTRPRSKFYLLLEQKRIIEVNKLTRQQRMIEPLSAITINYTNYAGEPRSFKGAPSSGNNNYIVVDTNGTKETFHIIINRSSLFPLNAIFAEWRDAGIKVSVMNGFAEVGSVY